MCHGELARRRPPPRYLTAFYMWMSVGGMIGGIAAGLVAPHVFNWVAEYPILIVLALLCRPGLALAGSAAARALLLFAALVLAARGAGRHRSSTTMSASTPACTSSSSACCSV